MGINLVSKSEAVGAGMTSFAMGAISQIKSDKFGLKLNFQK